MVEDFRRPIRIANCSGFYGDRLSAMAEMLRGGEIDVLTGDYLAEVTMLVLAKNRIKDPVAGYARTFLTQIEPLVDEIAARGVKVVVNAGGLAPAILAERVRSICLAQGVNLSVAHIEGDDVRPALARLQEEGHVLAHLDSAEPLVTWPYEPLTANAYLGGWGIVDALKSGADIVICPRVTDASLIVGPAAWWHGWVLEDWDMLAGAVAAGHVIECGTQATGGNFSGFNAFERLQNPGFPLAEVAYDGTSIITKHPNSGGVVTTDTVLAQLLYEIQGTDYLNPDVVTHLDTLKVAAEGPDRVSISGTRGAPPPATTKVAITAIGGFQNAVVFAMTGIDVDAKAKLIERAFRTWAKDQSDVAELRFEMIGTPADDPTSQLAATTLLRVSIKGSADVAGRAFFDATIELGLASYPGLFMLGEANRNASMFGIYWPTLLLQSKLDHRTVLADGTTLHAPIPPSATLQEPQVKKEDNLRCDWGSTEFIPLASIANMRSGDKGGNANLGVWVRTERAYNWLRSELTVDALRELLPDTSELQIDRYELPNILALNFVIRGLLDDGATATLRIDRQAKALGEYVRSRRWPIPVDLIGCPS